jgi:hypothetical protein
LLGYFPLIHGRSDCEIKGAAFNFQFGFSGTDHDETPISRTGRGFAANVENAPDPPCASQQEEIESGEESYPLQAFFPQNSRRKGVTS